MSDMRMEPLAALAEAVMITESRQQAIDLVGRRLMIDHSLVLHRDGASAGDIRAMLNALTAAGMPETATLKVDGSGDHTRMYARWATEPGIKNPAT